MADKKKEKKVLQGDAAAKLFEKMLGRMEKDATLAMDLLNKFSGGKLEEKYKKDSKKKDE